MRVVTVDVDGAPPRVVYEDGSVVVVSRDAAREIARDFLRKAWVEHRDGAR